jgi:hypothetical protein
VDGERIAERAAGRRLPPTRIRDAPGINTSWTME